MKIRIKESELRKIVTENVRKHLAEGLASKSLQRLAKQHGGISSLDKSLQLDKLDADFTQSSYGQTNFYVTSDPIYKAPAVIRQFLTDNPIIRFKDRTCVYMVKPEFMRDEKVKSMIAKYQQSSEDLQQQRNDGIEPVSWYEEEEDDGRWYTYKQTHSPEQVRQGNHRRARGVKQPGAQGNGADYDKYVEQYLCKKYNGEIERGRFTGMKDGEEMYDGVDIIVPINVESGQYWEYYSSPECRAMRDEFRKYGFGEDEYGCNEKKMTFTKGKSVSRLEIDDKGLYPDYFMPYSRDISAPKIGTSEFQGIKESIKRNLKEAFDEIKVVDQIPNFDRNKSYGKFDGQWMSSKDADQAYWESVRAKRQADAERLNVKSNMRDASREELKKTHITDAELKQRFPWIVKNENEPDDSELIIAYNLIFGWQKKMGRPFTYEAYWTIKRYFTIHEHFDDGAGGTLVYPIEPSEQLMDVLEKASDKNTSELKQSQQDFQQGIDLQKTLEQ